MKKRYLLVAIIAIAALSFVLSQNTAPERSDPQAQVTETLSPASTPLPLEQLPLTVTPLVEGDAVQLILNYKDKKTSEELQSSYKCTYLVNAGFYTKEENPVAYVKTGNTELGRIKDSLLFDGFLSINEMKVPRITRSLPQDTLSIVLQTGPILVENGRAVSLSIKNDKEARRVFALVSGENKILFGMVRSSTLQDLPRVVFQWAKDNGIAVADAINLDGGSASTYRGPNGIYPEISPIGSAFCITTS